VLLQASSRLKG